MHIYNLYVNEIHLPLAGKRVYWKITKSKIYKNWIYSQYEHWLIMHAQNGFIYLSTWMTFLQNGFRNYFFQALTSAPYTLVISIGQFQSSGASTLVSHDICFDWIFTISLTTNLSSLPNPQLTLPPSTHPSTHRYLACFHCMYLTYITKVNIHQCRN